MLFTSVAGDTFCNIFHVFQENSDDSHEISRASFANFRRHFKGKQIKSIHCFSIVILFIDKILKFV